jgi:hypothetical protein
MCWTTTGDILKPASLPAQQVENIQHGLAADAS